MRRPRRPVTLFALAALVSVTTGTVAGVTTRSDAATPATPGATTAATGRPKVPDATTAVGPVFLRPGESLRSDDHSRSWLVSGGLAAGPQHLLTTTTGFTLELEEDGDLVEYQSTASGRTAVWSAGTRSSTPTVLKFQHDGNVVLRDGHGEALWATGTAGRPAAYFDVYGNGQVVTQDATGRILSAHGPAETPTPGVLVDHASTPATSTAAGPARSLVVRPDGGVDVVDGVDPSHVVWTTGTAGVGPVRLVAQDDGDLVLRQVATGRVVWESHSHGPKAYYQFDLQDDGNIVLYRTDGVRRVQAVWSTGVVR